jgi:tetratricopeptide (TPR) repeat protein
VYKLYYIIVLLLALPARYFGQDIAALQKEAERLEPTNQEEAFKRYEDILKIQPVNVNALTKCSELCSTIGHRQPDKTAQINYFKAGRRFAEVALRLDPKNSEANFAMALAMGRIALISSGREKIQAVSEIKRYAELSVKYDPTNFKPYHALGKWHYEVSNLNGLERTAARLLYGGLPAASLKECIYYYEKSRSLNPEFTLNYLELARAYHRNDQNARALEMLNKLMTMPFKTEDDARVKEEGKKLLKEWSAG